MWKQPKWETNKQKSVERLNEMKSRLLEKVNKFDKLAELTQKSDTNYKYKKWERKSL